MGDRMLSALSLARRAGALAVGYDATCQLAKAGKAALVVLAQDASAGTKKRVAAACLAGGCKLQEVELSQNDIANITRKPAGVLAITNKDLAVLFIKAAGKEEPV